MNKITSRFNETAFDSTEYKHAEVERILDRVNLEKIKRQIRLQSPYEAYRDTNKDQYSNMTSQEKDQIFYTQWKNMSNHEKTFYEKLAEMNYLREEFEISQSFFKNRQEKIKSDSTFYLEQNVKDEIENFRKSNPQHFVSLSSESLSNLPAQQKANPCSLNVES